MDDPHELDDVCAFLVSDDASFTSPLQIIKEMTSQKKPRVILLPPVSLGEFFIRRLEE